MKPKLCKDFQMTTKVKLDLNKLIQFYTNLCVLILVVNVLLFYSIKI